MYECVKIISYKLIPQTIYEWMNEWTWDANKNDEVTHLQERDRLAVPAKIENERVGDLSFIRRKCEPSSFFHYALISCQSGKLR